MINYKEQLKDPRWAKRSREIMERDNFTCQLCGKKHTRLNVHHIRYIKELDYWDYPDELLMTVCEKCHAKIHGKQINTKSLPKRNIVMYFDIVSEDLTPNAKIVLADFIFTSHKDKKYSYRQRAKTLNISLKSYELCVKVLREKGYLDNHNNILYEIKNMRYFPLLIDSGLKSELLIFYSYLKNKSEHFGGVIDTFKYKLAEEFCTTKIAVTNMLNRLYRKGFAERLKNGKLKIN